MVRTVSIRRSSRRGITRIHVLVVGVIVLVCGLVLVPAISSARASANRLTCMCRLKAIGMAIQAYASGDAGQLPPLSSSISIVNSLGEKGDLPVGWPILVLSALDESALLKAIRQNGIIDAGQARIGPGETVYCGAFSCPMDESSVRVPGGLSYVVNAGFMSRDLYYGDPQGEHVVGALAWIGEPGDDDAVAVHAATGVLWQANERFQPSLDSISEGDGATTTILMTENLQAGDWYDVDATKIGFGFPVANSQGKVPLGAGTTFESAQKPLNTEFPGGNLLTSKPQDWRINRDLKVRSGSRPRPSSNHAGGINVIMCDDSGRQLNENIDPFVYLKLITTNGVKYGEAKLDSSKY